MIFALTPKGKELLGSRFFGIIDTFTGEYERRLLENQIKTKNWREIRFAFSDAAVEQMRSWENNGGEFQTRNIFEDIRQDQISYGLNASRTNPATIEVSFSSSTRTINFASWSNRDLAITFKVSRPETTGNSDLIFYLWGNDEQTQGEMYYFRFPSANENALSQVLYMSFYEGTETEIDGFNATGNIKPNLQGYYTIEFVVDGDNKSTALFINGLSVMQQTRDRGRFGEDGNFIRYNYNGSESGLAFMGSSGTYKIKDFSVAFLTEDTED